MSPLYFGRRLGNVRDVIKGTEGCAVRKEYGVSYPLLPIARIARGGANKRRFTQGWRGDRGRRINLRGCETLSVEAADSLSIIAL